MSMICETKVYAKKFDRVRVLFYRKTWSLDQELGKYHKHRGSMWNLFLTKNTILALSCRQKVRLLYEKENVSSFWEAFTCKTITMVLKVSGKFFFYLSLICVIVKFLIGKMGSTQGFYASPVPKLNRKCHNLSRNFQQKTKTLPGSLQSLRLPSTMCRFYTNPIITYHITIWLFRHGIILLPPTLPLGC